MTRVFAAAALLIISSASAFACPLHDSASAGSQKSTVAAQQPSNTPAPPPASTPADKDRS